MRLVDVTNPTSQPVTLGEAREQVRVLDNVHDTKLIMCINAATSYIERLTESRLMERTMRLELDDFPSGEVDLGVYPVTAVSSVAYDDADNAEQTLVLNTDYYQSLSGMRPRVSPVSAWPASLSKPAAVRITMTAGYANRDQVPDDLRMAVLKMVQELFANNGDTITNMTVTNVPIGVHALAEMWRRFTSYDAQ